MRPFTPRQINLPVTSRKSLLRPSVKTLCFMVVLGLMTRSLAQDSSRRFEDFNTDPRWESYRSRLLPNPLPLTRQDFGWRNTLQSNGKAGEIAGWVQRSVTPAWFAKIIPARTLNDKLSASGKFAVTRDEGGSGVLFGWFNERSRGWRTPNSLVLRLDGNGGGYWVFYEYGTRNWLTGGAGCFEGDRYQTTPTKPFRPDGTLHTWSLDYDPNGADGNGLVAFVLDGMSYTLPLSPGHKADGAEFNRFGLFNLQTTGSGMEVSFGELKLDGESVDLSSAAGWDARGNKVKFEDRCMRPFHDFGWMPTSRASKSSQQGDNGKIGGVFWRDEKPAYYANRVGPLSLEDELFASGTIRFNGAGSDSGVYLGWFDSTSKTNKLSSDHESPQKNLLAVLIEGPSRVGHYFRAAYSTATGEGVIDQAGPIIRPDGRSHRWSIRYSPQSEGGVVSVQLSDQTQTLAVSPEHRKQGASFDRFGFFNMQIGGHFVDVTLDDLSYSEKAK